jgi:hypothetical protein
MPSFVPSKTKYMLLHLNFLTGLIGYLWIGGFKFAVLCMVFYFWKSCDFCPTLSRRILKSFLSKTFFFIFGENFFLASIVLFARRSQGDEACLPIWNLLQH